MKKPTKKQARKKATDSTFQPGIVTFLIALISVLSLVLLSYLGVIFS